MRDSEEADLKDYLPTIEHISSNCAEWEEQDIQLNTERENDTYSQTLHVDGVSFPCDASGNGAGSLKSSGTF